MITPLFSLTIHGFKQIIVCEENDLGEDVFLFELTNYFNGLFVVEFFVPVEHPQERK